MIIGSLLGFAGSILPGVFKLMERRQDNRQELEVMKAQIIINEGNNQARMDLSVLAMEENSHQVAVQADIKAGEREGSTLFGKFILDLVAAWRAVMRPAIVTTLLAFYVWVKYQIVTHAIEHITIWSIEELAALGIWTAMDMELLFLGITFYLGKRGMEKIQGSR